jgi:exopolysaccharide biosynthesis protein
MVIDGRQPGVSLGTSTEETAAWLRALGATHAVNLDGGGSSALAVREGGDGRVRVMNRPSDAGGERAVANALVIASGCTGRRGTP